MKLSKLGSNTGKVNKDGSIDEQQTDNTISPATAASNIGAIFRMTFSGQGPTEAVQTVTDSGNLTINLAVNGSVRAQ